MSLLALSDSFEYLCYAAFTTDGGPVVRDHQKLCRTTRMFLSSGPVDNQNI